MIHGKIKENNMSLAACHLVHWDIWNFIVYNVACHLRIPSNMTFSIFFIPTVSEFLVTCFLKYNVQNVMESNMVGRFDTSEVYVSSLIAIGDGVFQEIYVWKCLIYIQVTDWPGKCSCYIFLKFFQFSWFVI